MIWPLQRTVAIRYILTVVLLGCVASRPVTGWRLPPSNSTQITDNVWRRPAVVFQMHAGDNCWHCYRLNYPRRPAPASSRHGAKQTAQSKFAKYSGYPTVYSAIVALANLHYINVLNNNNNNLLAIRRTNLLFSAVKYKLENNLDRFVFDRFIQKIKSINFQKYGVGHRELIQLFS